MNNFNIFITDYLTNIEKGEQPTIDKGVEALGEFLALRKESQCYF